MKIKSNGFVQYGVDESVSVDSRYEHYLVADREGLRYLRLKIDEVLDGADEVVFDSEEIYVDLVGIRVAGRNLSHHEEIHTGSGLVGARCVVGLLLILCVFVLGIWKVAELLLN